MKGGKKKSSPLVKGSQSLPWRDLAGIISQPNKVAHLTSQPSHFRKPGLGQGGIGNIFSLN